MDLANFIDYDRGHPVELAFEGKPTGVTFYVAHMQCDAAMAASDQAEKDGLGKTETGLRVMAACITDWDWGENKFNGEVPKFTPEKALEVLRRIKWATDQISDAAINKANFTNA